MLQRVLVLLAVLALTVGTATTSFAGVFDYSDPNTRMEVRLGALAPIFIQGGYVGQPQATVSGADLTVDAGIFSTVGNSAGTSLFTGVDTITNLIVTAANSAGTFTGSYTNMTPGNEVGGGGAALSPTPYSGTICPAGCLGGQQAVSGQVIVAIGGGTGPAFPNSVIGIGGTAAVQITSNLTFLATGGPFVTGKIRITGVTTNIVQLPNRSPPVTGPAILLGATSMEQVKTFTTLGGFLTDATTASPNLEVVNTVTISGSNSLTVGGEGQVTLISPLRVDTQGLVNTIPGFVSETFVFVPEPGTLLLLASGAAGLVMIGRRRSRK